jgi:hypothetical protein
MVVQVCQFLDLQHLEMEDTLVVVVVVETPGVLPPTRQVV